MKYNILNWKTAATAGLLLMVLALFFGGHHIQPEALAGLSFLAIGDTEAVGMELKALLQKQGETFEAFKTANDALLKAKADGKTVAEHEEKLAKINAEFKKLGEDFNEVVKKANRPQPNLIGADGKLIKQMTPEQIEHKTQLGQYLRTGKAGELRELEQKALSSGSD